ncbi:MAG: hypothetical protein F6K24_51395, partial [Okeania sp. SIO2D1]|nr:hypothetical protein [Okeania sp. SIO2D1]
MASLFQEVLEEIRKRRGKYEDIEGEIIKELLQVYKRDQRLLIEFLERGGFDISNLKPNESPRVIVSDFLSQCNGLDINKLYKIFSKLNEQSPGLNFVKEVRDTLELAKNSKINASPTYTPLPDLSILPISIPPIKSPTGQQVVEKTEETTILKQNLDPEIYDELENFLQKQKWKEADLETMNVLVEIADIFASPNQFLKDREKITWLDKKEINNIPDEALKNINRLWNEHSQGHFGFKVQLETWSKYQRTPHKFDFKVYQDKFAKSIGW